MEGIVNKELSANSYNVSSISCNVQMEIDRLQAQTDLFWKNEFDEYVGHGLINGMHILELASGPGFITEKLLQKLEQVTITCVEIDPVLADIARQRLSRGEPSRCSIILGSATRIDSGDNMFDCAIARLLLEHLPEPIQCLREVYRVLKPNGIAIFIDNDFDFHARTYPNISELSTLYKAYCAARIAEGGLPTIGRELPTLLKRVGFSEIDFRIICAHSEIIGDDIFRRSEGVGIAARLVKDGYMDKKDLVSISKAWRNMLNAETHGIVRQLSLAAGIKRGEKSASLQ